MTPEKILEENKLIAEFMGFRTFSKRYPRNHGIGAPEAEYNDMIIEKAKYHSSWDWLMPVVEKIELLGYKITIEGFCCVVYKQYGEPVAYCSNFDTKINATYHAVTAFVNWYYKIK